jgi:hypothetical protein
MVLRDWSLQQSFPEVERSSEPKGSELVIAGQSKLLAKSITKEMFGCQSKVAPTHEFVPTNNPAPSSHPLGHPSYRVRESKSWCHAATCMSMTTHESQGALGSAFTGARRQGWLRKSRCHRIGAGETLSMVCIRASQPPSFCHIGNPASLHNMTALFRMLLAVGRWPSRWRMEMSPGTPKAGMNGEKFMRPWVTQLSNFATSSQNSSGRV